MHTSPCNYPSVEVFEPLLYRLPLKREEVLLVSDYAEGMCARACARIGAHYIGYAGVKPGATMSQAFLKTVASEAENAVPLTTGHLPSACAAAGRVRQYYPLWSEASFQRPRPMMHCV